MVVNNLLCVVTRAAKAGLRHRIINTGHLHEKVDLATTVHSRRPSPCVAGRLLILSTINRARQSAKFVNSGKLVNW